MVGDPRADVARGFQIQDVGRVRANSSGLSAGRRPLEHSMPPTTHRRKLTQKELRAPDEFTTFVDNARDFFVNNLTQMIVSAAVVVVVGAIVIGVYYYERHRDSIASARFYDAITALNAGQNKPAETQFKQLADEEPGRRLGRLVALLPRERIPCGRRFAERARLARSVSRRRARPIVPQPRADQPRSRVRANGRLEEGGRALISRRPPIQGRSRRGRSSVSRGCSRSRATSRARSPRIAASSTPIRSRSSART